MLDELSGAAMSARATLAGFLHLLSLEARRAGLALSWMVAGALAAAVCIACAWLGLLAALAMWAVSLGAHPIAAVAVIALASLLAGAGLVLGCIGMSRALLFPATRRQLGGQAPALPTAP